MAPTDGQRQVRVTHPYSARGHVGVVVGPATQVGMDVVIDFGGEHLMEFREWEIEDA